MSKPIPKSGSRAAQAQHFHALHEKLAKAEARIVDMQKTIDYLNNCIVRNHEINSAAEARVKELTALRDVMDNNLDLAQSVLFQCNADKATYREALNQILESDEPIPGRVAGIALRALNKEKK